MKPQKALGRGLSALLQKKDGDEPNTEKKQTIVLVPIDSITPNTEQPRTYFDAELLEELATSIRNHGILQPLLLEKRESGMRLVAGERRFRAAKLAGLTEVPAFIGTYSDVEKREIALVENIQREDLHPLDIAQAIESLIDLTGWTHEETAQHLGMSRSKLTNLLRLLGLSEIVQSYLKSGSLSMSHARAMAVLNAPQQSELCTYIVQEQASVRETEELCMLMQKGHTLEQARSLWNRQQSFRDGSFSNDSSHKDPKATPTSESFSEPGQQRNVPVQHSPEEQGLIDRMTMYFGTKVQLSKGSRGGELRIRYYDEDDFMRIVDLLDLPEDDIQ